MGRKANVAVARAKARVVGVMVAGWGRLGGDFGSEMGDFGDNIVNVCRREIDVVTEICF
jgi:hypothetical protein